MLAGGTGRRLGGVDKASLSLEGVTLLDALIGDLGPDVPIVVAGDEQPTSRPVVFRREEPHGGGPAAGIAAAVALVRTPLVGVVAVDMPWAASVLHDALHLLRKHDTVEAAIPVDESGHHQYLCMAWRTDALQRIVMELGEMHDRPVKDLVHRAQVIELSLPADEPRLHDIDTPDDLRRARDGIPRT